MSRKRWSTLTELYARVRIHAFIIRRYAVSRHYGAGCGQHEIAFLEKVAVAEARRNETEMNQLSQNLYVWVNALENNDEFIESCQSQRWLLYAHNLRNRKTKLSNAQVLSLVERLSKLETTFALGTSLNNVQIIASVYEFVSVTISQPPDALTDEMFANYTAGIDVSELPLR